MFSATLNIDKLNGSHLQLHFSMLSPIAYSMVACTKLKMLINSIELLLIVLHKRDREPTKVIEKDLGHEDGKRSTKQKLA